MVLSLVKSVGLEPTDGISSAKKPYPLDADGNKIRPEKENQKTGQKQKKSK